jgi:hypothetical protein
MRMSLVFLEALVNPLGLPQRRFASSALALHGLVILLLWTSIHGSSKGSNSLLIVSNTIAY